MDITTIVVAASIPSAFTGFCFWLIEQNIQKRAEKEKAEREERQKAVDEREQIREKNELCIINSVNAAIALGEPQPEPCRESRMRTATETCTQPWTTLRRSSMSKRTSERASTETYHRGRRTSIMKNINWKRKLTSRKLWTAVASFVSMMIVATGGAENTATQVTALIMAGASVVAYIIGEGLTDSANIGSDDPEE